MMRKPLVLLTLFVGVSSYCFGQLTKTYNLPRGGDQIIKQQVDYKDPGRSGEEVVWDFSRLKAVNPEYKLTYRSPKAVGDSIYLLGKDTLSAKNIPEGDLVVGMEHYTMYYYQLQGESLVCLGHENPVTLLHHTEPLLTMNYPFDYGSKVTKVYHSDGMYSSQEPIRIKGRSEIEGDAYGKMLLPSGDTLDHVLRIKTIQYVEEADSVKLQESDTPLNMRMETYRWYAKGYRYPVFETVRSFTVADTTQIENFATAFFYPPQEHYYLENDPENLAIIDSLWNEKHKSGITDPTDPNNPNGELNKIDGFAYNCYPNPVINDLHIEYMLDKDAEVQVTLYDMNGKLIKNIPQQAKNRGLYNETLDCSNLPQAAYILHLTVNNQTITQKINKK